jgi:hypothetical protein
MRIDHEKKLVHLDPGEKRGHEHVRAGSATWALDSEGKLAAGKLSNSCVDTYGDYRFAEDWVRTEHHTTDEPKNFDFAKFVDEHKNSVVDLKLLIRHGKVSCVQYEEGGYMKCPLVKYVRFTKGDKWIEVYENGRVKNYLKDEHALKSFATPIDLKTVEIQETNGMFGWLKIAHTMIPIVL